MSTVLWANRLLNGVVTSGACDKSALPIAFAREAAAASAKFNFCFVM